MTCNSSLANNSSSLFCLFLWLFSVLGTWFTMEGILENILVNEKSIWKKDLNEQQIQMKWITT